MKKRLDLILNGKGGVGKSFFAVNFVQFLKDHSIRHVAIDTDNENSTLKRFHPEAVFVDLSQSAGIDRIFVEVSAQPLVVVDCRAASTDIFLRYFNQLGAFEALQELNASLTLILPVSHDADSAKQIQVLSEQFSDNANYIVVKNHLFGDQFDIYQKSKTRRRILGELDGNEIEMPVLCDWLVVALNQSASTITTALRGSKFFIMDRQRLKFWQRDFEEQIETARDLLLPERKRKGASHE
jgi:CobQ/CobB/MinD/ParA nucleotide binding domain